MCGIAGFTGAYDAPLLERLQRALEHRGPDQRGTLSTPEVSLSSNRLSIIDLAGGRQPIFNEDRSCAIVFNGEIYNYRELRAELAPRHRFETATDTEVILHLYEEKGTDAPRFLRGDFAFCIWDARGRSCFLSRDPLGVKPLYYAATASGDLLFASELAPLLGARGIRPRLDMAAVAEYLASLCIAAPRTLIDGIRKLHPGESLLWKEGSIRTWRHWRIPEVDASRASAPEFRERALELLRQAVRRRLIADVPVGAFLSGGLDSSLIVALASEETRGLRTFSIGYGEADFDELAHARAVSRRFGTDHHELVLRPEAEALLEEVIAAMDEPMADSSAIPTYLVARETRRSVKVALSGIGGDELFSGYPRYVGAKVSEQIPGPLRRPLAAASGLFRSTPSGRDLLGRAERFARGLELAPAERYVAWTTFLDRSELEALLRAPREQTRSLERDAAARFAAADGAYLDAIFRYDVAGYLVSDLLKLGDAMTMAQSLELRVPFCDVDLVEEVARTPSAVRFPGYRLKPVLREIARRYLPDEIIERPKQGFMIPIGRWFRHDLRGWLEETLRPEQLPTFLDPAGVGALARDHLSGRRNRTHVLWGLLVLVRWLRMHPEVEA